MNCRATNPSPRSTPGPTGKTGLALVSRARSGELAARRDSLSDAEPERASSRLGLAACARFGQVGEEGVVNCDLRLSISDVRTTMYLLYLLNIDQDA